LYKIKFGKEKIFDSTFTIDKGKVEIAALNGLGLHFVLCRWHCFTAIRKHLIKLKKNSKSLIMYKIKQLFSSKNKAELKIFLKDLLIICINLKKIKFWEYFKKNWVPYWKNITQIYKRNCCSLNSTNNINENKFKLLTNRKQKKIKKLDELILKIIEITEQDNFRKQYINFKPSWVKELKKTTIILNIIKVKI
jgi:hypothetical protein